MKKYFVAAMRVLGIVLVAHALMLLGADEIATIEAGYLQLALVALLVVALVLLAPVVPVVPLVVPVAGVRAVVVVVVVRRVGHPPLGA